MPPKQGTIHFKMWIILSLSNSAAKKGLANYGLWAKSSFTTVFVFVFCFFVFLFFVFFLSNYVLELRLICLHTVYVYFQATVAELKIHSRYIWPISLKCLLSCPYRKSLLTRSGHWTSIIIITTWEHIRNKCKFWGPTPDLLVWNFWQSVFNKSSTWFLPNLEITAAEYCIS